MSSIKGWQSLYLHCSMLFTKNAKKCLSSIRQTAEGWNSNPWKMLNIFTDNNSNTTCFPCCVVSPISFKQCLNTWKKDPWAIFWCQQHLHQPSQEGNALFFWAVEILPHFDFLLEYCKLGINRMTLIFAKDSWIQEKCEYVKCTFFMKIYLTNRKQTNTD